MVRTMTAGHKSVETDAPPEDGSYSGPWHVATLEEFLALPEIKPALEFEEGRITQKVSPRGPHSVLQAELLEIFNRAGRPNKIARAFPELRTTFAGRSYVPDVSVYTWPRIARTDTGEVAEEFDTPPDIAIEILSPEQSLRRLRNKGQRYAGNGVRFAMLVIPARRTVEVSAPGARPVTFGIGEQIDLSAVIPAFALSVGTLFLALRAD